MARLDVKQPCRGCIYFNVCGDYSRRVKCDGRATKRDIKKDPDIIKHGRHLYNK